MLKLSTSSLFKSSIIWLCLSIREDYSKQSDGLSSAQIKQVLYYHNIFRYFLAVGNTKQQPPASNMQIMKWNQSLVKSLDSIPNRCILNRKSNLCPQVNVYRIKKSLIEISKIVRAWFNAHRYYDYSTDKCSSNSCDLYKRIVGSNNKHLACLIKQLGSERFFLCQYGEASKGQPYKKGTPCSSCEDNNNVCYKHAFCVKKRECTDGRCDDLMSGTNDDAMQGDQPRFCQDSNVNCKINFYQHMCPMICSSVIEITTTKATTTTKMETSDENEVCRLASVDCSIDFFKLLCPKSCESALCRDPNIDCRNIFYMKCQICLLMNQKMSDFRITTTTMASSLENAIGLIDPKCQDLSYDNYCTDRGEMCFHSTYEVWMKKFCCSTCTVLNICFDYLDFKSPGKCADILSSGMCSNLWSQTYCRKTCRQC